MWNRLRHLRPGGALRLALAALAAIFATSCRESPRTDIQPPASEPEAQPAAASDTANPSDAYRDQRARMVAQQLAARDIVDQSVLEAMGRVPRRRFLPPRIQSAAYVDSALPIGHGQTISQPYIVALMTQLVRPTPEAKALDIGTGSGYQAAVLAELVKDVYSIEIVEPLAKQAAALLEELGYTNIHTRYGDGYRGWPEEAPFDIIIVAAAPDHVPQPLVDQLAPGGTMVIPVGDSYQDLLVIEKDMDGVVSQRNAAPVAFVPMTGEAEDGPAAKSQRTK